MIAETAYRGSVLCPSPNVHLPSAANIPVPYTVFPLTLQSQKSKLSKGPRDDLWRHHGMGHGRTEGYKTYTTDSSQPHHQFLCSSRIATCLPHQRTLTLTAGHSLTATSLATTSSAFPYVVPLPKLTLCYFLNRHHEWYVREFLRRLMCLIQS